MLAVATGETALTFAAAVTPLRAGKVTDAAWPTLTEAISASAMFAVIVICATFAMVAKLVLVLLLVLLPALVVAELALPEDPPLVLAPTEPSTATTRPAIGAKSVEESRLDWAVATALIASVTDDWAEMTCCLAELVWLLLPPLPDVSAAAEVLASESEERALARLVFVLVSALERSVVSRVPRTSPAATVAPRVVLTVAITPETAKDAATVLTAAIDPLAVTLLDTVPASTVPVSREAELLALAAKGFAMTQ